MNLLCEIYAAFVRTEIACVRAIQSKNVATFANINLSQFICDFPKETNAKVVYGDHIEISVFVLFHPVVTKKCCDRLNEVSFNQISVHFAGKLCVNQVVYPSPKGWLWCFK